MLVFQKIFCRYEIDDALQYDNVAVLYMKFIININKQIYNFFHYYYCYSNAFAVVILYLFTNESIDCGFCNRSNHNFVSSTFSCLIILINLFSCALVYILTFKLDMVTGSQPTNQINDKLVRAVLTSNPERNSNCQPRGSIPSFRSCIFCSVNICFLFLSVFRQPFF